MSRNGWRLIVFGLLCLTQLAVPVVSVMTHERTVREGELFRFRCAPVDPVDLFRGRYVALGIEERRVTTDVEHEWTVGDSLFVQVLVGDDGFARLGETSSDPPAAGAYLAARVERRNGREVWLDLPFDRYYVAEGMAEDADRAYRELTSSAGAETFVTVRIHGGKAVLDELYLDDLPLREYLEQHSPPED
jgi:uncharacterized membrane-anchored protein